MLDRLYSAIMSGPSLSCKPHSSRQRVDFAALARLGARPVNELLAELLTEKGYVKIVPSHAEPPTNWIGNPTLDETQNAAVRAWEDQEALIRKLKVIADDATTYAQDTGAHVLNIGFPIVSFPPKESGDRVLKRVLAPVLFVPVELEVKSGRAQSIILKCSEGGIDRVVPNAALLAWIEKQTGIRITDVFADEEGSDPWREIREVLAAVLNALEMPSYDINPETPLRSIPKVDSEEMDKPALLPAAVLGLFPLSNQGLIQDTEALLEAPSVEGPISSFISVTDALIGKSSASGEIHDEFLIATADPCQAKAVRIARTSAGLVVHGPPGTGKSQTITNIIGDHLAQGQRVLFVCDKRTALDVVRYRLESIGLGHLCATVHDPQKDQKQLYLSIRQLLDEIPEKAVDADFKSSVGSLQQDLKAVHSELKSVHENLLIRKTRGGLPLHALVGKWLGRVRESITCDLSVSSISLDQLREKERELTEIFSRAMEVKYTVNCWRDSTDISLQDYLSRPLSDWQNLFEALARGANEADSHLQHGISLALDENLITQAASRRRFAERLDRAASSGWEILSQWATLSQEELTSSSKKLSGLGRMRSVLENTLVDYELDATTESFAVSDLSSSIASLNSYLEVGRKWYSFFYFSRRSKASAVTTRFGLAISVTNALRVLSALELALATRTINKFLKDLPAPTKGKTVAEQYDHTLRILEALAPSEADQLRITKLVKPTLSSVVTGAALSDRLRKSAMHAESLNELLAQADAAAIFSKASLNRMRTDACGLKPLSPSLKEYGSALPTLSSLLSIREVASNLAPELRAAALRVIEVAESVLQAKATLECQVLRSIVASELSQHRDLLRLDDNYFRSTQKHYRDLKAQKVTAVRKMVVSLWLEKQRSRVLASTGTRLNGLGAELRRRLMLRGSKAMRLRQVISAGAQIEGGDPLFDLKPVWMASPETVAQVLPRKPIFDVLIFDEASQCRLEEALPVLIRAKRVVIAGDPKQLPPTRFFESVVATSESEEAENDQGLFELQQTEVEDLLTAALNLEIEQSFLDVHYRSRNSDLIEFSNESFYDFRLQPIPAHPQNRSVDSPLRLIQVNGIYQDRTNEKEAIEVVRIVKELLGRSAPPSIGIACFNLVQRDLISDLLDKEAAADPHFSEALEESRQRQGEATFEGLFVKNLENVQGDERDHIIISTTYGPTIDGKFRKNFGPLTKAGGGRRLNVLVTRAREAVHLVTSIPPTEYQSLPSVPPGQTPKGSYLLFSYLRFAERLGQLYAKAASGQAMEARPAEVVIHHSRTPSEQAMNLGHSLKAVVPLSSEVHWGNEGFCVDVAIRNPFSVDDVTLGIICDGSRYDKTDDSVEWDIFRHEVLEGQGWILMKTFSPALFMDLAKLIDSIKQRHNEVLASKALKSVPAKALN